MKKTIFTSIILTGILLSMQSCSFVRINSNGWVNDFTGGDRETIAEEGPIVTETFNTAEFSRIESSIRGDIAFVQSDSSFSVQATGSGNIIDKLDIVAEGGTLFVNMDDSYAYKYKSLKLVVTASSLEGLLLKGSGDFDSDGITTGSLDLTIMGAGDIDIHRLDCAGDFDITVKGAGDVDVERIVCKSANVLIQGAGDVELEGKADFADITIQGAGDVDISKFKANDLKTKVQGIGNIERN